jgi:hypothetical protein
MKKSSLVKLVDQLIERYGLDRIPDIVDKVKKFGMGYSATCCHQKNHESTLHNAGTVGNIPPVSSVDEKQRQFHEGDRTEAAK